MPAGPGESPAASPFIIPKQSPIAQFTTGESAIPDFQLGPPVLSSWKYDMNPHLGDTASVPSHSPVNSAWQSPCGPQPILAYSPALLALPPPEFATTRRNHPQTSIKPPESNSSTPPPTQWMSSLPPPAWPGASPSPQRSRRPRGLPLGSRASPPPSGSACALAGLTPGHGLGDDSDGDSPLSGDNQPAFSLGGFYSRSVGDGKRDRAGAFGADDDQDGDTCEQSASDSEPVTAPPQRASGPPPRKRAPPQSAAARAAAAAAAAAAVAAPPGQDSDGAATPQALPGWPKTQAPRGKGQAAARGAAAAAAAGGAAAGSPITAAAGAAAGGPRSRDSRSGKGQSAAGRDAPKRPKNKFFFFMKEALPKLRRQQPALAPQDLTRAVSKLWRSLSDVDKRRYENAFKADQVRYKTEMDNYNSATAAASKSDLPVATPGGGPPLGPHGRASPSPSPGGAPGAPGTAIGDAVVGTPSSPRARGAAPGSPSDVPAAAPAPRLAPLAPVVTTGSATLRTGLGGLEGVGPLGAPGGIGPVGTLSGGLQVGGLHLPQQGLGGAAPPQMRPPGQLSVAPSAVRTVQTNATTGVAGAPGGLVAGIGVQPSRGGAIGGHRRVGAVGGVGSVPLGALGGPYSPTGPLSPTVVGSMVGVAALSPLQPTGHVSAGGVTPIAVGGAGHAFIPLGNMLGRPLGGTPRGADVPLGMGGVAPSSGSSGVGGA